MRAIMSSALLVAWLGIGGGALLAEQTWTGSISDSRCKGRHEAKEEHGKKLSDADCTTACVKDGAKYVLVSDGKVYPIANQDFAGLKDHAGERVTLSGDMKGKAIVVSKIAAAGGGGAQRP